MVLTDVHCRIGLAITFFSFALGVWGILAFLRGSGVSGSYFGALVVGELLILAQALVGVILILTGAWPMDTLHFLYGIVVFLAWIMVYIYTKGATSRREMIIYGVVSLVVMGLAIRGLTTGAGRPVCLPF